MGSTGSGCCSVTERAGARAPCAPLPRRVLRAPDRHRRARAAGQAAGAAPAGARRQPPRRAHRRGRGLPGRARRRLARAPRADPARGHHVRPARPPLRLPDLRHVPLHELRHRGRRHRRRGPHPRRRADRGPPRSGRAAERPRQALPRPGDHASPTRGWTSRRAPASSSPTTARRRRRRAASPRIGVDYAGAWAARKLRFFVPGNPTSRKRAEAVWRLRDLALDRREHARQRRADQTVGDLAQDEARAEAR